MVNDLRGGDLRTEGGRPLTPGPTTVGLVLWTLIPVTVRSLLASGASALSPETESPEVVTTLTFRLGSSFSSVMSRLTFYTSHLERKEKEASAISINAFSCLKMRGEIPPYKLRLGISFSLFLSLSPPEIDFCFVDKSCLHTFFGSWEEGKKPSQEISLVYC